MSTNTRPSGADQESVVKDNLATSYASTVSVNSIGGASNVIAKKVYAFSCSGGGFETTQQFNTIHRTAQTILAQYDVTGAIEVLMDVRVFNNKLSITKDASNIVITNLDTEFYDSSNNIFLTNHISITTADFIGNFNALAPIDVPTGASPSQLTGISRVVSVGRFSTLYADFAGYVAAYFGFPNATTSVTKTGFSSLFTNSEDFNPNLGVFDASAFILLLNQTAHTITQPGGNPDGSSYTGFDSSIVALSGSIDISNITQLLTNAVDSNCFGNRDPVNGTTSSYADSNGNRRNYGVTDGFYADDLFFIPVNGFKVTLKVGLDSELFLSPLNVVGPSYDSSDGAVTDASGNIITSATESGFFNTSSSSTTTLIQRVVSAPILIRLANLSVI